MKKLIKILKSPKGAILLAASLATAVTCYNNPNFGMFAADFSAGAAACLAIMIYIDEDD